MNIKVSENLKAKVYQSFGRSIEEVNEDVKIIKEWLKTQLHLPEIMDEAKIRNFLLQNKFSIENTKKKIDYYYTIRSVTDWFQDSNPNSPVMKEGLKHTLAGVTPKLVDGIYSVFFFKTLHPGAFSPREAHLHFFNVCEVRLQEDFMAGDILVIDYKNFSFEDHAKETPSAVLKIFNIYKKVFSLRFKAGYLINAHPGISILLSILKKIIKPKLLDRIQVSEDDSIIKKALPDDILPKDYGGSGLSLQEINDLTSLKLAENQDRFDKLDYLRVDESLRPDKLENSESLGFYGNFKKLNLD